MDSAKCIIEKRFPDAATRPELHQVVAFITARFEISIEMMTHLKEPAA